MGNSLQYIKNAVTNNWGLKLMAGILALLTFFSIRGVTNDEDTYDIPIEVIVDKGIAILDQDPTTASVTFRGSAEDLKRLDVDQVKAVVTPEAGNPDGSERVSLGWRDIQGFQGVRVVSVQPQHVNLSFDTEAEQQFPVAKPEIKGTPLVGRAEIDYTPKTVTIRGPKRQLQRMIEKKVAIETEPLDVTDRVKSFTTTLKAFSPGETWVSQIEPSEIQVKVNIVTETISTHLTNMVVLAVVKDSMEHTVRFTPGTVDVSLHGRPDVINNINRDLIKVFVDCVGLDSGRKHSVPVSVHLPAEMNVTVAVVPDRVDVEFMKKPSAPAGRSEKRGDAKKESTKE